jgi:Reverse transcriptase (RNA-dependent DNA polymerase)
MNEEVHSLERKQTWTHVKPPNDKKIIGCKWVFKMKVDGSNLKVICYKTRLVVKGYNQIQGMDFNDMFSLIINHTSIWVLLSLVTMKDFKLEQFDVKTAFLHCDLEEQIYMNQPKGFKITGGIIIYVC